MMACLMLSASRGHYWLRLAVTAINLNSANVAHRCVASEFHCTAVCPRSFFSTATRRREPQNPQSTGAQAGA